MNDWQVGLYVAAVLIPLAAFAIEAVFIRFLGKMNAYVATAAIGLSFVLSLVGFVDYTIESGGFAKAHHEAEAAHDATHAWHRPSGRRPSWRSRRPSAAEKAEQAAGPLVWEGHFNWVSLGSETLAPAGNAPARPSPRCRSRWPCTSTTWP